MKLKTTILSAVLATASLVSVQAQAAFECPVPEAKMAAPKGFPTRPLNMVVPYGPGGGSGQVAAAMAKAVSELTGMAINRDHKPGGSGLVGLGAYMAFPADGYSVLEHIDDSASAFAVGSSKINPTKDLIPLVTSQITFSQIYIRSNETRFKDWAGFIKFVAEQDGKATIANVSGEGSMERMMLKQVLDQSKVKMQQISFDKGGPRYAALKGGQVDALFEQPGDVRGFLDSGDFKPILTLLNERPGAFKDTPAMNDVGLDIKPLYRFRGFYVKQGVPADRLKYLQWAFQRAFCEDSYQAYNEKKYMNLINSFRDTDGSVKLINDTVEIYQALYKELGMIKK
ncbi:MAG: tripartite tricarboxylate transporter substrate-binding protein [Burkholderiaceae bacterium]